MTREAKKKNLLTFSPPPPSSLWSLHYDSLEIYIWAFQEFNGIFYAGSGVNGKIFQYSGGSWTTAYTASDDNVRCFTLHDSELWAGCGPAGKIYSFNGSSWTEEYDLPVSRTALAMESYGGDLYVGTDALRIYKYNGSTWTQDHTIASGDITSLATYNGNLYAGWNGNTPYGGLEEYNGTSWSTYWTPVSPSAEYGINALAVHDGNLYAGTDGYVLKFTGSSEEIIFTPGKACFTLFSWNNTLYAGFNYTGSANAEIWSYDGVDWTQESDFIDEETVWGFGVYQNALYAGTGDGGKIFVR